MRAILFHNPGAGDGKHSSKELLDLLRAAGIEARYCATDDDDFAEMLGEPVELVVIAGGDGTVAKVLTRLSSREALVGLLPLGTANNIALSLGLTADIAELIGDWSKSRVRRFDAGLIAGPWGECRFVESVGLGALAKSTKKKKKSGKISKTLLKGRKAFCEAIESGEPHALTLEIDGERRSGEWIAIEIMNIPATGPRLKLSDADPGDGKLDVVLIGEGDRDRVLAWMEAADDLPLPVPAIRAREVRFDWTGSPTLRIDDTRPAPPEDDEPAEIRVGLSPHAFSILARPQGDRPEEVGVEPLQENENEP